MGVGDVERTVQGHGEIPAVDHEFERQDAERKGGGQRSSAENDIAGQSAATRFRQDGLRKLLHALVYGAVGGYDGWNAGGGSEAGWCR